MGFRQCDGTLPMMSHGFSVRSSKRIEPEHEPLTHFMPLQFTEAFELLQSVAHGVERIVHAHLELRFLEPQGAAHPLHLYGDQPCERNADRHEQPDDPAFFHGTKLAAAPGTAEWLTYFNARWGSLNTPPVPLPVGSHHHRSRTFQEVLVPVPCNKGSKAPAQAGAFRLSAPIHPFAAVDAGVRRA